MQLDNKFAALINASFWRANRHAHHYEVFFKNTPWKWYNSQVNKILDLIENNIMFTKNNYEVGMGIDMHVVIRKFYNQYNH